jgi:hypothetical protein
VNWKYNESSFDKTSQAGNPTAIFTAGKGVVHAGFAATIKARAQGERVAAKQISSGRNADGHPLSFDSRCNTKIA